MADVIVRVDELDREIEQLRREKASLVIEISDAIETLEDDYERTVLTEFYIARAPMTEVADAINYSVRRAYHFRKMGRHPSGGGFRMIKLLKGNCLDLLRQLEPGCADLVLIDPPYSSGGLFAGDRKQDTRAKYTDADFNGAARFPSFSGDNMDQHSFIQFMTHVSMELRELTKEGGTIAAFIDWRNLPAMTDAIQMAGWVWRGVIVWDKGISRNIPGRFRNDCEYIVWGTNGRKEVDWKAAKGAKAICQASNINGVNTKQKHHQTEKPVELLKALIQICPRGGDRGGLLHGIRQHGRRLRPGGPGLHRHRAGRPILRHGHQAHPGGRGRAAERLLESRRTLQIRTCYTGKVDE